MKNNILFLKFVGFLLLFAFIGCSKPESGDSSATPEPAKKDPGIVTGLIENTAWDPVEYYAIYYPKLKQVVVKANVLQNTMAAIKSAYDLELGVNIDSLSPLKTYPMVPNGDNTAQLKNYETELHSDHNMADAGGNIRIIKMDTVSKKFSCELNFTAYAPDRSRRLQLNDGKMTDITLWVDNSAYNGDYVECAISGANNTKWKAVNFFTKRINCFSTGNGPAIQIDAVSPVGRRFLSFVIPFANGKGTFPVYPAEPPYFYCGSNYITSSYVMNSSGYRYNAIEGSISITELDISGKKLAATFTGTYRQSNPRQETIHITNGVIRVSDW